MCRLLLLAPLSLCVLGSCKDNEIRTYKVATDSASGNSAAVPAGPMGGVPKGETAQDDAARSGSVVWQAAADWKQEQAGQFLTAAYTLPGGGRVTISKLPGDGGGLAANINRWRGQMGLKPLADKEVSGQPLKIAGSDAEILLFNLTSESSADDADGILAGVLPLKSETWYFKFTGPVGVLKKSGGIFMEFLQTVRKGGGGASASTANPAPASSSAKKIHVTPPAGWTPSEGSSMRAASFSIAGPDGTSADVSVVPLPGDSGSVLSNVNRWRSQVQLAPLDSEDDPALGKKSEIPAGEIFISHMVSAEPVINGKKAAIGSAILKRPGMTWFFKITGDASLVETNLEKFDTFVRSATFPE
ncbi:MAG: hypothetical protein ABIS50_07490 [Luteolibacter sp.]|uniref:hypothetical protein n=1 Tax=Luteolibacter sp. TaxID=1962973 RepID=UPI00326631D5